MSTSLLSHAFGIRGYQYIRTDYRGGVVFFPIGQDLETCPCSACGAGAVRPRGRVERRFPAQPLGRRPTTIVLLVPPVECLACGVVRPVEIAVADPRRGSTRSFERYALELSRRLTIRDVASHWGVGWDVIQDIPKRDLTRRFAKPRLKDIAFMAIDEIAVAKGHRYLRLVMDLDRGADHVGDGKGADALKPFGKRLRPRGARIEAVAMDLSGGYQSAVRAHRADAGIVFDHFHVVKLFHDRLSDLRRAWDRAAADVPPKEVLKGTRWRRLKNAEDLDPKKDEKSRLKEALKRNEP
jgi:transposase